MVHSIYKTKNFPSFGTGLWKRISIRLKLPFPLKHSFCSQLWSFLTKQKCVSFYELAEPRELIKTFDRADNTDIESMTGSTVCIFVKRNWNRFLTHTINKYSQHSYTIYKYNPICRDNGALRGSCQDFDTRKLIESNVVKDMTYDEVLEK